MKTNSQIKLTIVHNGKEHSKTFIELSHAECKLKETEYLKGFTGAETIDRRIVSN